MELIANSTSSTTSTALSEITDYLQVSPKKTRALKLKMHVEVLRVVVSYTSKLSSNNIFNTYISY